MLCDDHEPSRAQAADPAVLPTIAAALRHESAALRAPAAHCIRAISRSKAVLARPQLAEAKVAEALCDLLPSAGDVALGAAAFAGGDADMAAGSDAGAAGCSAGAGAASGVVAAAGADAASAIAVTSAAARALSNLSLEFSQCRDTVRSRGAAKLAALAGCSCAQLAVDGLCGLRNACYMAPAAFKRDVMQVRHTRHAGRFRKPVCVLHTLFAFFHAILPLCAVVLCATRVSSMRSVLLQVHP